MQLFQPLIAAALICAAIVPIYWPVGGQLLVHAKHHPYRRPYTFPAGGRTLVPGYRLVALYGVPDSPVLGALGDQPLDATIARVKSLAAEYQPLMREHALPTLEIITTVASAYPEPDDSYSRPIDTATLQTWVTTARQSGVYVVLDLQPGRDDFLSQAKQYRPLLAQPNVGLALDPEWRLKPAEVPLEQIGTVSIGEVNSTVQWLADLVRRNHLPQKLLLLHEFRLSMLPDRTQLDTSHPELAYVIQMDGQGPQPTKMDTWQAVTADPPANVSFGWKNFYQKDSPVRTPAETMQLTPQPRYVSYQ